MKLRAGWILALIIVFLLPAAGRAQQGGELHFCLHGEPKTFNPLLVDDEASETIRYLTGGVLIRVNRETQVLQPELAASWKISEQGRRITFHLRSGLRFSDGTPFTAEDVAYTMNSLMDSQLHSSTGDSFRSGEGQVKTQVSAPDTVVITFPAPVAGLERLFDQVAIFSAHSPKKEMAVAGPFYVAEYKPGSYVLLQRNQNYWKRDGQGRQLPYLNAIRLDIQRNRDIELLRFRRGEIHLINSLDAEYFDSLNQEMPGVTHDAGTGLDAEFMWFNQVPTARVPEYKKEWFRTAEFRRAISAAINRADLCRVVFAGHARPAYGPVSPANHFWFDASLPAPKFDALGALRLLAQAGFWMENGILHDRAGNRVEFSLVTNAGNKLREQMATMIQQDLLQIGIKVNVVTLDFSSLIERMTRTFDYEACLLGLVNTDLDPNGQMNVWLSSAENHQWNPSQAKPATSWEAEIDRLMRSQGSASDEKKRKSDFDKVQQIVAEQQPFIYLVNKDALSAVSANVLGAAPVVLRPQAFWNADVLHLSAEIASRTQK